MKNLKRTISAALIFAMMLTSAGALLSCGDSSDTPSSDTTAQTNTGDENTPADTENLSDLEKRQLIPDDLPAKEFDGRTFRFAIEANKEFEIWSEDITGEVTNDAIYNRNITIEERFKIKIEAEVLETVQSKIATFVTSGDDTYDVMGFQAYTSYTPITAKVLVNWYDVPYMNFDKPWYNKITNDAATFNGRLFNLTSSLAVTQMQYTYAMFFNQRITEEFGYAPADLYKLVYDGEWTFDKFFEIVSGIYIDANGDSKKDKEDIFGYATELTHPSDVWLAAFDQPVSGKDADGMVTIDFVNEKTTRALEKVYDLTYNTESTFVYPTQYDEYKYFANSKIAICPLPFKVAYLELREMSDAYGILPYPKWDAAQENYLTNIFDQYSAFAIPKTAKDLEFIGIIMEALNAESYKTVYPAFYDVALKNKYTEDLDTAAMVDIVMEGANMDFSFMFGESVFQRTPYMFRDLIRDKNVDLMSKYSKLEKALRKSLEKLYTYYED
jgi:hypothetical protein